jgi:hypothetical protein
MARLNLKSVKVSKTQLTLSTVADVGRLEQRLGLTLPRGYSDYVTTLGDGFLCDLVRVYLPSRIARELKPWRQRIKYFWFWDQSPDILKKEAALQSIVIADTLQGDELLLNPVNDRLYVLPRNYVRAFEVGRDFLAAVEWLCGSGMLVPKMRKRHFDPYIADRKEVSATRPAAVVTPTATHSADRRLLFTSSVHRGSRSVLVSLYYLTAKHRRSSWDGVSAFAFDVQAIVKSARRYAKRVWGKTDLISSIQIGHIPGDGAPYYFVTVEFRNGEGANFTVILDMDGRVVVPEIKKFRNHDEYYAFQTALFQSRPS